MWVEASSGHQAWQREPLAESHLSGPSFSCILGVMVLILKFMCWRFDIYPLDVGDKGIFRRLGLQERESGHQGSRGYWKPSTTHPLHPGVTMSNHELRPVSCHSFPIMAFSISTDKTVNNKHELKPWAQTDISLLQSSFLHVLKQWYISHQCESQWLPIGNPFRMLHVNYASLIFFCLLYFNTHVVNL